MSITVEEYLAKKLKKAPTTKYHSSPCLIDGIRFASKLEGSYYNKLKEQQKAGAIDYFLRQVPLNLPGNIRYIVDFVVFFAGGAVHYIDVKGFPTPMFKLKLKQVEALYPIRIEIVSKL